MRWLPQTATEREMVQRELDAIVSSQHFKNSKRYPALLRYVVDKTLDGHSDQLKERTLGVEVFDRQPDYDTNADPVVRFTAGETRKRIAQYYHHNGKTSCLQIDLPLGSYVPVFTLRATDTAAIGTQDTPPAAAEFLGPNETNRVLTSAVEIPVKTVAGPPARSSAFHYARPVGILLIAIILGGVYIVHKASQPTLSEKIWGSVLSSPGSVLMVVGNGPRGLFSGSESEQTDAASPPHGPYNHISFNEAVSISRLSDVLVKHSKPYQLKEADLATLQDMHERPVVLIGAYNNLWTMRLTEPLQFHFKKEGLLVRIIDSKNPDNRDWAIDYIKPYSAALYDYAIVARYFDATTHGPVLIVAGIGAFGTEIASESVATPQTVDKLLAGLPSGWENKNLELVIRTTIINGQAGAPTLVSATTW